MKSRYPGDLWLPFVWSLAAAPHVRALAIALVSIICEAHYAGVSTRKMSKVSKSDLQWLLPRIKDLVKSSTREFFALAWSELIKAAEARGKDKLLYRVHIIMS